MLSWRLRRTTIHRKPKIQPESKLTLRPQKSPPASIPRASQSIDSTATRCQIHPSSIDIRCAHLFSLRPCARNCRFRVAHCYFVARDNSPPIYPLFSSSGPRSSGHHPSSAESPRDCPRHAQSALLTEPNHLSGLPEPLPTFSALLSIATAVLSRNHKPSKCRTSTPRI